MKHALDSKVVYITPPGAKVDDAAFTTTAVDTKGFSHLSIELLFGDIDVNVASASIRHSDASNMSNATAFATGGADFALATASGSDNKIHRFEIDLRGKKRYIDFEMTGGDGSTGTYCTIRAELTRAPTVPVSAAQRGFEQLVHF